MNQLQTNPLRETKKSFKEILLSSLLFRLAMARHSPCSTFQREISRLKYYTSQTVLRVHGRWWSVPLDAGHLKGENLKKWTPWWPHVQPSHSLPGNPFPGMDAAIYVYPLHLARLTTSCKPAFSILDTPPPTTHARGPHVLSEEVRPWRACLNHLSRISQDISHWHQ